MSSEVYANVDPILREIDRLVFTFNSAEHSLRRLAFLLIDSNDERIGEIIQFRKGINTTVSTLSPESIAAAASDASQIGQELGDLYDEVSQLFQRNSNL